MTKVKTTKKNINLGGRPPKYKTVEEINEPDGLIKIQSSCLKSDCFKMEKELLNYIVSNIEVFTRDILNDDLISFETEYPIEVDKVRGFGPRGRRVDIFLIGKKKKYIIELKCPTNNAENRMAIGQILDYGREFLDSENELVLITTKFDINTSLTINHYNLPIRYIFMNDSFSLEHII